MGAGDVLSQCQTKSNLQGADTDSTASWTVGQMHPVSQATCLKLPRRQLRGMCVKLADWQVVPAEKAFEECMMLETKVQLLQKAAFGDVDVEKGLAAFHVSLQGPSLLCHQHVLMSM